jgi:hypothetical protein
MTVSDKQPTPPPPPPPKKQHNIQQTLWNEPVTLWQRKLKERERE